jgi:hypothetical protein
MGRVKRRRTKEEMMAHRDAMRQAAQDRFRNRLKDENRKTTLSEIFLVAFNSGWAARASALTRNL